MIAGLFDGLKASIQTVNCSDFWASWSGLIDNKYIISSPCAVDEYRNTGGFDMICRGGQKLETEERFARVARNCAEHGIKAIIIIKRLTRTQMPPLAQYMLTHKTGVQVIGCQRRLTAI